MASSTSLHQLHCRTKRQACQTESLCCCSLWRSATLNDWSWTSMLWASSNASCWCQCMHSWGWSLEASCQASSAYTLHFKLVCQRLGMAWHCRCSKQASAAHQRRIAQVSGTPQAWETRQTSCFSAHQFTFPPHFPSPHPHSCLPLHLSFSCWTLDRFSQWKQPWQLRWFVKESCSQAHSLLSQSCLW